MSGCRMQFNLAVIVVAALLGVPGASWSQQCSGTKPSRVGVITGIFAVSEAAAILVRHNDWWTTPSRAFHVTWDESPNKSQDRLLHATASYHASRLGAAAWDWACVSPTAAGWLGAALGLAIALPKEIGDGFHEGKGFSAPDMLWSAGGAVLPALYRSWEPLRALVIKVNYWPSDEFRNRTGSEPQLESDYAGQRYYLAVNPGLLPSRGSAWPDWLGFAVGHSVPHWISAPPVHQWYFTVDINFRGLPIRAEWWGRVAALLDVIHVPAPGIRIQEGAVTVGLF